MMAATRRPRHRGFTLVELMIVVAVAIVLLLVASPSLQDFVRVQRLKGINAQMVTDLQLARSEAAARGVLVHLRFMSNSTLSCYILFTDTASSLATGPSDRCDCTQPSGSRCTEAETTEIRTVVVPASQGTTISVPSGGATYFAFDPVTGGILLPSSDVGTTVAQPFAVIASIDTARALRTNVGQTGRPSVCAPSGSTLPEPAC